MTIKEFNTKIINQGFAQTDKDIVFQTPDGKVYTDAEIISITQGDKVICKVKLNDKIKPKFKVGDVVTNSSGLYPNVKCTITEVNEELQYYCYKEVNGRTYFKDQDKLTLVKYDKVRPPVEDSIKLDGFNARFAKNNVLTHNLEHYPLIRDMINIIIKVSNEGKICHTFIVPYVTKNDTFGVYYDEDEICGVIRWHFKELGFNVKDKNDEVNNRTEFFISW